LAQKIKMEGKHFVLKQIEVDTPKIYHLVLGENLIRHIDGGFSKIIVEDSCGLDRFYLKELAAPFGTWSDNKRLKINETRWVHFNNIIGLGVYEKYFIELFEPEKEEETVESADNNKMICGICCINDKNSIVFPCNHFFCMYPMFGTIN
jgi:hypothetical protein